MNGDCRDGSTDANEHFVGEYASELTPHWTMFEVTRSETGFALKAYEGTELGELAPRDDALVGKVFGTAFRLHRENGGDRYIFSGEAQATTGPARPSVLIAVTLVKRVPPPSAALERQFGVSAEALVRHVRQSEHWIHQVESLHIAADSAWTRTAEGIAHRKKQLKAQFPDEDFSREKFWGLFPSAQDKLEIHIDRKRFRYSNSSDREEDVQIWDGRTFLSHIKYYTHDQESYNIAPNLEDRGAFLLCGFAWPRAQRHKFWWTDNDPDEVDEDEQFGQAEEFVLMAQQDYRGVPCYVLECHPKRADVRRWFVGVKDGLLRGNLSYGPELRSEFWTDRYREVRPGCWFPMCQGYKSFDHDDALRSFLSGWRDITITQIEVDRDFPDELFEMEFKEGVRVVDSRFGGPVAYTYKKGMTEQDWEQIRVEARTRAEEDSADRQRLDARVGREPPAFPDQCQWLNTAPLTWPHLRGKAVVLQFWSHTCGPCHNHIHLLQRSAEDADMVLIGVHTPQNTVDEITEIMAKYHADGPVCVDLPRERSGVGFGLLSSKFGVRAIPSWFVIGPEGKVVGHAMGPGRAFQMARESLQQR